MGPGLGASLKRVRSVQRTRAEESSAVTVPSSHHSPGRAVERWPTHAKRPRTRCGAAVVSSLAGPQVSVRAGWGRWLGQPGEPAVLVRDLPGLDPQKLFADGHGGFTRLRVLRADELGLVPEDSDRRDHGGRTACEDLGDVA